MQFVIEISPEEIDSFCYHYGYRDEVPEHTGTGPGGRGGKLIPNPLSKEEFFVQKLENMLKSTVSQYREKKDTEAALQLLKEQPKPEITLSVMSKSEQENEVIEK